MSKSLGNPMLAGKIKTNRELEALRYPVYIQPKIDGYRCLIHKGTAFSRSLKPIPNKAVQLWAKTHGKLLDGFDGELVVGPPNHEEVFKRTRAVGGRDNRVDFNYIVFDMWNQPENMPYRTRLENVFILGLGVTRVLMVDNNIAESPADVLRLEAKYLAEGYEGIIIRSPNGPYKNNRSTIKEGWLLAVKRWTDDIAIIRDIEPLQKNFNEPTFNERGYQTRSSSKEGKVAIDTMGRLVCDFTWPKGHPKEGQTVELKIGSGFDDALRKLYWVNRHRLIGKPVEFKYFAPGSDEAPRHPIFLRIRDKWDT